MATADLATGVTLRTASMSFEECQVEVAVGRHVAEGLAAVIPLGAVHTQLCMISYKWTRLSLWCASRSWAMFLGKLDCQCTLALVHHAMLGEALD